MTSEINTICSHVHSVPIVCSFGKCESSPILADQCEHIIIVPVYNSSASTSRLLSQSPWTFEQCDGPNDFLLNTLFFRRRVKRELLSTVFKCSYALWLHSLLSSCFNNHLPLPVSTVVFSFDCVCWLMYAFSHCPKVHRYWAVMSHRPQRASVLTQRMTNVFQRSTQRTAQTLYCFNGCYTVKRTNMFLLCQVPG